MDLYQAMKSFKAKLYFSGGHALYQEVVVGLLLETFMLERFIYCVHVAIYLFLVLTKIVANTLVSLSLALQN